MKVKLQDVIDGIAFANAQFQYFYHKKTEEVLVLMDNIYGIGKDKAMQEDVDKNADDYISLPNEYEVDEFAMMADFVEELEDSLAASALFRALDAEPDTAPRLFRQSVKAFDLAEEWEAFRNSCYSEVARQWCEENGIDWE
ncbi:MAG: UPF0158 family protein [Lachnospiraceae bacterium]|nr:UPF0158 family protein [Lachnospiraceae bacterium]